MLDNLSTEGRNNKTMRMDEMSSQEILTVMNAEDAEVPLAVKKAIPEIAKLVEQTISALKNGGRVIYAGAGTSGRLGVLDAVECPPTFGTDPAMVVGLIAGGEKAFTKAVEGAEDSLELGGADLAEIKLTEKDVVVGIAASGRTPYVIGALKYAKEKGAHTGSISCNQDAEISKWADCPIEVVTGSEVLTGSTRLKAGTAQKLVLNMISTATMIGLGKAYNNLMVDVQPTNEKLVARAIQIIVQATGVNELTAEDAFQKAKQQVKPAIVMILADVSYEEAKSRLEKAQGFVKEAISITS
ncbi:N-acetylmuramic acid-6-phosphate etherase [Alkalihalophilus pseudofirmus OF4]|uniref:N-acetylmuramic acid 6-phosphate etherase n=1 Tax=Alkalihalophilus pseudofirmus (strain ATCC BAA-2126 / JCM 17055 / OF4) TaxID=398511 RepID=D3FRN4_ALKPO|nr:N-acetylmuramic acid 6-phosphate etherase [Alkalihalophilus pseudofirmus]ADC51625.1 N-acetylmuramic acid-6-phosphate etherase [Alkalihalophilus pseudofirmus OF4]